MLYNAYPPFRLNFVIDTHVYPCDRDSTIQLFSQFDKSQVDLSVGNRVNKRGYIMGAGILFRSNPKTKAFWIEVYQTMRRLNNPDDQSGIYRVLFNKNPPNLSFRWLSFNWCYLSKSKYLLARKKWNQIECLWEQYNKNTLFSYSFHILSILVQSSIYY